MSAPWLCAALLSIAAIGPGAAAEPELLPLAVLTAAGQRIEYQVEMADTPEERRLGLMDRLKLAPERGMLLWYPETVEARIWMKNTYIALDILFIDAEGRVVRIAGGEPQSLELIPSGGPVRAVLELNAGQSAVHGIAPGDRVEFPPGWPVP
jgi:hypothetical protein